MATQLTTPRLERLGPKLGEHNEVQFSFHAPGKHSVSLVGDFNHWDPSADPMYDADGVWTCSKTLANGRHRYRLVVDDTLEVSDPFAREIERARSDKDPPAAIIQVGEAPFEWRHDHFQRPHFTDLIYYELLIHDFSPKRNFEGAIERLDYLAELGINAIELMPVYHSKRRDVWGYEPNYFCAPRPEYGTPETLKRLVDEAHARGIAVVLDIIFAHTGHYHPFKKLYPYEESPWYGQTFGAENEYGLPPFDHEKPAAQRFCREVIRFWLEEYHVDGYRLDYINLIDEKDGMGTPQLIADIRACRADAYVTCEMLPENPEKTSRWDNDAAWHWHVGMLLRELLLEDMNFPLEAEKQGWPGFIQSLSADTEGYASAHKMINYCESHDEERLSWFLREAGLDDPHTGQRVSLAAVILFTMGGQPMLYQGQEWGESASMNRHGNPLHWELLDGDYGRGLHDFFKRLIALRHAEPALRSEHMAILAESEEKRCVVYHRWDGADRRVVVAANFSPHDQPLNVPFPASGPWYEYLTGQEHKVKQRKRIVLPSFTARIWRQAAEM